MPHFERVPMAQPDLRVRLAVHAHAVARLGIHHLPDPVVEMEAQVLAGDRWVLDLEIVLVGAAEPDGAAIQDQLLPPVLSGDADQLRPLLLGHFLNGHLCALALQVGEADGRGLGHAARLGLRVCLGLCPGGRLLRRRRDAGLRRALHRRRRRPLLGAGHQDQVVLADLDQVPFVDEPLALDLLAVDANAGEAVQVLDVVVAFLAQEPPVPARDVLLRQPHQVLLVAADGDLIAEDRNDGLPPLVVFDDQLHGRPLGMRRRSLPQPRGCAQPAEAHHLPMKACTWSQSVEQKGRYFSSHFIAFALSFRYAYPYPRLRYACISVFLSAGDCASAACAAFTAPGKSRAISLSDEALARRAAFPSRSLGLGPSCRAGSARAVSLGWHCGWSACASAFEESNPSTLFTSARQRSSLPADLAAVASSRCFFARSEEHTSELQSRSDLVCRLLLET